MHNITLGFKVQGTKHGPHSKLFKMKCYSSSEEEFAGSLIVGRDLSWLHWFTGGRETTELHQFLKHIWLQILCKFWMFLSTRLKLRGW